MVTPPLFHGMTAKYYTSAVIGAVMSLCENNDCSSNASLKSIIKVYSHILHSCIFVILSGFAIIVAAKGSILKYARNAADMAKSLWKGSLLKDLFSRKLPPARDWKLPASELRKVAEHKTEAAEQMRFTDPQKAGFDSYLECIDKKVREVMAAKDKDLDPREPLETFIERYQEQVLSPPEFGPEVTLSEIKAEELRRREYILNSSNWMCILAQMAGDWILLWHLYCQAGREELADSESSMAIEWFKRAEDLAREPKMEGLLTPQDAANLEFLLRQARGDSEV